MRRSCIVWLIIPGEITMSTKTISVTDAKQRFTELVKGVHENLARYVVTKNGEEAAVVISAEEYDGLLETLDILTNKPEARAIAEGSQEARRGRTVSFDEYRKRRGRKDEKRKTKGKRLGKRDRT